MMRKMAKAKPAEVEADFHERVMPGLVYCQRVGNIMGGTLFMSLASTIDNGQFDSSKRIGCFSYGSGCCSEFFSGIVSSQAKERQQPYGIENHLNKRYQLSMDEYHALLIGSGAVRFGTRNVKSDFQLIPGVRESCNGNQLLFLEEIKEFHRKYRWCS